MHDERERMEKRQKMSLFIDFGSKRALFTLCISSHRSAPKTETEHKNKHFSELDTIN